MLHGAASPSAIAQNWVKIVCFAYESFGSNQFHFYHRIGCIALPLSLHRFYVCFRVKDFDYVKFSNDFIGFTTVTYCYAFWWPCMFAACSPFFRLQMSIIKLTHCVGLRQIFSIRNFIPPFCFIGMSRWFRMINNRFHVTSRKLHQIVPIHIISNHSKTT